MEINPSPKKPAISPIIPAEVESELKKWYIRNNIHNRITPTERYKLTIPSKINKLIKIWGGLLYLILTLQIFYPVI